MKTRSLGLENLEQACETAGVTLLRIAGILHERRKANAAMVDDFFSIEVEWEVIEETAHGLLKTLAAYTPHPERQPADEGSAGAFRPLPQGER